MLYPINDKIEWTTIFVSEFGRRHHLTLRQAFNYLLRYQGIDFVDENYGYVHTQSFESMIEDITQFCHKNGGAIQ